MFMLIVEVENSGNSFLIRPKKFPLKIDSAVSHSVLSHFKFNTQKKIASSYRKERKSLKVQTSHMYYFLSNHDSTKLLCIYVLESASCNENTFNDKFIFVPSIPIYLRANKHIV